MGVKQSTLFATRVQKWGANKMIIEWLKFVSSSTQNQIFSIWIFVTSLRTGLVGDYVKEGNDTKNQ